MQMQSNQTSTKYKTPVNVSTVTSNQTKQIIENVKRREQRAAGVADAQELSAGEVVEQEAKDVKATKDKEEKALDRL